MTRPGGWFPLQSLSLTAQRAQNTTLAAFEHVVVPVLHTR